MLLPNPTLPATATGSISISISKAASRAAIAPLWMELERQCDPVRLSVRWTWVSTWLDTFGDIVPHWFAIATDQGIPVGACLITCMGPWPLRNRGMGIIQIGTSSEPIGHGIATEYNDILVKTSYRAAFARELLRTIRKEFLPLAIRFPAFAEEDFQDLLHADPRLRRTQARCPIFELDRAREQGVEPIALLRSSVRSRLRRSARALQPVETEWATDVDQANDILDELVTLHQERWTNAGRRGAFSSDRFLAFHRALIPKLLHDDRVILFRVRHGAQTVGCLYSFIENGSVLFYQSGIAQFQDNKARPGLTTHLLCMEQCLDRGFDTYNFLAGDHRYKDELSTSSDLLVSAQTPGHPFLSPIVHYAYRPETREYLRAVKHFGERLTLRLMP